MIARFITKDMDFNMNHDKTMLCMVCGKEMDLCSEREIGFEEIKSASYFCHCKDKGNIFLYRTFIPAESGYCYYRMFFKGASLRYKIKGLELYSTGRIIGRGSVTHPWDNIKLLIVLEREKKIRVEVDYIDNDLRSMTERF